MDDVTVDLTPDGLKITMKEEDALTLARAILEDGDCILELYQEEESWKAQLKRPPRPRVGATVFEVDWEPTGSGRSRSKVWIAVTAVILGALALLLVGYFFT